MKKATETDNTIDIKLLACPFCAEKDVWIDKPGEVQNGYRIRCSHCNCATTWYNRLVDAALRWNTRSAAQKPSAINLDFFKGALAVLIIIEKHKLDDLIDEIVPSIGAELLVKVAKKFNLLRESGVGRWLRRTKKAK